MTKPAITSGHNQYIERIKTSSITVLENTLVWGIFEGALPGTWCLTLYGANAPARLTTRAIIVASGAFDRSIPFPGWDLPGVITAGAASDIGKKSTGAARQKGNSFRDRPVTVGGGSLSGARRG